MARGVDISMLRDPMRMQNTKEVTTLVYVLAAGIQGLQATGVKGLPTFRLQCGGSIPGSRLERPVGESFTLNIKKPDPDQAGWSEVYLRELLTAYGRFVCTQAICRRWKLLSMAFSRFGEFSQPDWSEKQLKAMVSASDYERYKHIEQGLTSLENFLVAQFMLCAMKNLMRCYGDDLVDGGLSYFREVVRWIFSEEGGVPLLAFRLTHHSPEEEGREGRMYSAPRDELEKLMREAYQLRSSHSTGDASIKDRLTRIKGVDLGEEGVSVSTSADVVKRMFDDSCKGLNSLLVKEKDIFDFLSVVLLRGSL